MTQYKGYYIDNVTFSSTKEIDIFIKENIIKHLIELQSLMFSGRYTAKEKIKIAREMTDQEKILHDEYEMTWEEIENALYK